MSEDEKKEIEPFLIDEKQYKVTDIVLIEINALIKQKIRNGTVAWQIRQATDNKLNIKEWVQNQ